MIIKKSNELNIDINAKDYNDCTAFHLGCENGHSKIAEMLLEMIELQIEYAMFVVQRGFEPGADSWVRKATVS